MKSIRRAALLITAFLTLIASQSASAQTLKEIVEKTVTTNPEVQSSFHTYLAALQEQKVAKGGYWPSADLVSTFRSQENLTPNVDHSDTPNSQTQLVLRQMLFDGFATRSEVARLDHAALVRYYELQNNIQRITLDLVKSYIDVQRYRQLVQYAEDNYVQHKTLFDRINERVTAGVARRVDLEQASGRLALAEANLLTETTNLQNVSARYQRLTGELPPDELEDVTYLNEGLQPTVNQALELAYRQNPELLSSIENIVATQQEVQGTRAKYMPRIDLQARKNLDVNSSARNSSLAADTLELTATFNLFNGFSDKARIGQASEKLNSALDLRDKACVDTRQTLVIAYNDVQSLTEQLGYRNQHQLSIEKAREAYRKQFDIGQRTLLDLLDTENEYFQARRTYMNTQSDLYTAYARTYASEGDLLNRLGVSRADLPDLAQADYTENYATCQAVAPDMLKINKAELLAKASTATKVQALGPANDLMIASANKSSAQTDASCNVETIKKQVNGWAAAWQHQDFDQYLSYYSKNFSPEPPLTYDTWVKQRRQRIVGVGEIHLKLSQLQVSCTGNKASISFVQDYSLGGYQFKNSKRVVVKAYADQVNKELQLEKSANQWQIVREFVR